MAWAWAMIPSQVSRAWERRSTPIRGVLDGMEEMEE